MKIDNYAIADAPRLGVKGWGRWMWRQVTSMRVALILLLLLALASIPGSVLPQWPQNAANTRAFIEQNGWWGRFLDATGFLDVFGSAWFTAIYVLLFASLIGCILPRVRVYWRNLRSPVPPVPARLDRYENRDEAETADVAAAFESARSHLIRRPASSLLGWRVRVDERPSRQEGVETELALSANGEGLRELGNLIFHLSLVGILAAVAVGSLLTYRGQAIIVEGDSFTNSVVDYDSFSSGNLFRESSLEPFRLTLDELDAAFNVQGLAEDFTAHVTLQEPETDPVSTQIQVNRPLQVDGGKIYLQGNGYAPEITVVDSDGNVAFSDAVPYLPQDGVYTSTGVVKVPDVTSGEQLGFLATLLPTAADNGETLVSAHPDLANPMMLLRGYSGDLGLDTGIPQNVYVLDESQLSPMRDEAGNVWSVALVPGQTVELPDGLGTFTWNDTPRYGAFDLRADPSLPWLLAASIGALVGLALSLFAPRRRLWLVAPLTPAAGGETTVVRAAIMAPAHDAGAVDEMRRVLDAATGRVRRVEEE
ncbi:cytochrome c biogenesis protein ResB [Demequina zhanjiangensis]|uniref:Cytochrome c biogenesis protein ResB n=1 Tax=Demequina zhanjiangensis TaxID=3051659 RepID=A0ABT8FX59_9MICO|nr:cytochrome c biogenesis protein ResB [Demequina sp. SYSU T00b26]MDN4471387.1 cytochrome c biogenesis protein ResB [Demequina sp. SYSU T00b26]